jgi:hypothetical protein
MVAAELAEEQVLHLLVLEEAVIGAELAEDPLPQEALRVQPEEEACVAVLQAEEEEVLPPRGQTLPAEPEEMCLQQ